MAQTITGQRLSELNTLLIGATGSKIYVVTQAGAGYQMSFSGLAQTLTGLYFNNIYQPKIEDWRFVHKTGAESITGNKTFVNDISCDNFTVNNITVSNRIVDNDTLITLSLNDGTLGVPTIGISPFISFVSGRLFDSVGFGNVTLDWVNRRLSGNWNAQGLSISGVNVATGDFTSFATAINLTTTGQTLNTKVNSLSGYLNTNFIPSGLSDNRYVNVTGNEIISGNKTFMNNMVASGSIFISGLSGLKVVCPDDGRTIMLIPRLLAPNVYTLELSGLN